MIPLVGRQRAVPGGRRAEQYICLHWQLYLLIVLKGVQVSTALLQALVQVLLEKVVKVLVKAFAEEVLLFSLSSTPPPRTRPAARVWAWGAKGLGCLIVLPAPGRRSSGEGESEFATRRG